MRAPLGAVRSFIAGSLALTAAACDRPRAPGTGGAEGSPAFEVWDSAGVEIVENHAPERTPESFWILASEPEIVLGENAGSGELAHDSAHLVWDVQGLARLVDRRVAILSAEGFRVLLFEPSGRFSKAFGRKGEGPGEFIYPEYLQYLPGDTLVVWNYRYGPVIHFDTSGAFLRHHVPDLIKITDLRRDIPGRTKKWLGPWLSMETPKAPLLDGSFVSFVQLERDPGDATRFRPEYEYVRVDASYRDYSLGLWKGEETLYFPEGRGFAGWMGTSFAAGGNPPSIYIADGATNEIRQFAADGALVRVIRRSTDPVLFRAEPWRKRWKRTAERIADDPQRGEEAAQAYERRFEKAAPLLEGSFYPSVVALQVDSEGHLWAREWSDDPDRDQPDQWSVFSPEGRWLGVLPAPGNERETPISCTAGGGYRHAPCWIDKEFFLGVLRDEMGVERVVGYRIDRKE